MSSTQTTPPQITDGLQARLLTLQAALGQPGSPLTPEQLSAALDSSVDARWLTLAVLGATLPTPDEVQQLAREIALDGSASALSAVLERSSAVDRERRPSVLRGGVTVDVSHTVTSGLSTGIQRVVRETVRRWAARHDLTAVAWNSDFTAMRHIDVEERASLGLVRSPDADDHGAEVVIPWRGVHVIPELAAEVSRSERLEALARFSGCRTTVIGYDMVPVTSSETVAPGMSGVFSRHLSAVRHYDRVAAISEAAAEEYRGWRDMLPATGLIGPEIRGIALPAESLAVSPMAQEACRHIITLGNLPTVLVVGSHERRKNHLTVLHAAELLWRDGLQFFLLFIGGNAWRGERFTERVQQLRAQGRPLETLRSADEKVLWSAYRAARFVVFPSLNEGFGLPAAEVLSVGTPVLTSKYGSLAEIAADGGALTIDPRDDDDLLAGMRRLLTDDDLLAQMSTEALARPQRTWDAYADETWRYLVGAADRLETGTA